MSGNRGTAHYRVILLHECTERKLKSAILTIAKVIEKSRLNGGNEEAESKAKELLEIVNSSKTEQEILLKIAELNKT